MNPATTAVCERLERKQIYAPRECSIIYLMNTEKGKKEVSGVGNITGKSERKIPNGPLYFI